MGKIQNHAASPFTNSCHPAWIRPVDLHADATLTHTLTTATSELLPPKFPLHFSPPPLTPNSSFHLPCEGTCTQVYLLPQTSFHGSLLSLPPTSEEHLNLPKTEVFLQLHLETFTFATCLDLSTMSSLLVFNLFKAIFCQVYYSCKNQPFFSIPNSFMSNLSLPPSASTPFPSCLLTHPLLRYG